MTGPAPLPLRKRVLIGAGSFADAESGLRLVEAIARLHAAELRGLLVSELAGQEMAQAFCARVVSMTGHIQTAPTGEQLRHLSRAEERAFRQALARLAEARGLAWSFESRTGELARAVFETFAQWDFFVVARRRHHRPRGRVLLLRAPGRDGEEGRRIAEALGPALGDPVETLEAGPMEDSPEQARLARGDAALVILDLAGAEGLDEGWLRRVLAAARCPVLILGPGAGGRGEGEPGREAPAP